MNHHLRCTLDLNSETVHFNEDGLMPVVKVLVSIMLYPCSHLPIIRGWNEMASTSVTETSYAYTGIYAP